MVWCDNQKQGGSVSQTRPIYTRIYHDKTNANTVVYQQHRTRTPRTLGVDLVEGRLQLRGQRLDQPLKGLFIIDVWRNDRCW